MIRAEQRAKILLQKVEKFCRRLYGVGTNLFPTPDKRLKYSTFLRSLIFVGFPQIVFKLIKMASYFKAFFLAMLTYFG